MSEGIIFFVIVTSLVAAIGAIELVIFLRMAFRSDQQAKESLSAKEGLPAEFIWAIVPVLVILLFFIPEVL